MADKHHKKFLLSTNKSNSKIKSKKLLKNLYLIKNIIDGFNAKFLEMSLAFFEPEFYINNDYVIKFDKNYKIELKEYNLNSESTKSNFDYNGFCYKRLNKYKFHFDYVNEKKFVYKVNYENIKFNESEPLKALFDLGIKDLEPIDMIYKLNKNERILYQMILPNNEAGKFCYLIFPKEELHLISFLKNYDDLIDRMKFYQIRILDNLFETEEKTIKIFLKTTINNYLETLKPYQLFLTLLEIEKNFKENYFLFLFNFIECAFLHEEIITLLDIRNFKQNIEFIKKDLIDKDSKFFNYSMNQFEKLLDEKTNVQIYFKKAKKIFVFLLEKVNLNSLDSPKSQNLIPTSYISIKNY